MPNMAYNLGLQIHIGHHVFIDGFTNFQIINIFLIGIEPFNMFGKDFIGMEVHNLRFHYDTITNSTYKLTL